MFAGYTLEATRGRETSKKKAKSKAAPFEKSNSNSKGCATQFKSLSHPPLVSERLLRAFFPSVFLGGRNQRRGELFIKGKEVFDALAVVLEWLRTVTELYGAVQFGVGFDQCWRRRQRVI